uniref:MCF.2 cell line derived transforming sequence n=1 Tax=Chelonoidis abingdonii TaxID=106734 RepID=A0A8C0GXF2_CHEAB
QLLHILFVKIAQKYNNNISAYWTSWVFCFKLGLLELGVVSGQTVQTSTFLLLVGGRGKDNGWIITFPENSDFNEASEEVLMKVLTYLTSVPSQHESDTQFILILDRRLDTWMSVKMTLQRIAASFPGNLQLVMVLRPTGFFQRTFTDIGFRFSQEDFLLKLPVVMLSSVSDLLMYIDEKQLTPEFGGTLEYRHSEWVIFRTAIESFALTVKEIAQMLQSFGTELAETELPDDMYSIERILALRTEKYCQLKGDITVVTKEGNVLLSSLEEPDANKCSQKQRHDRPGGWETVNRLLAQLHEMETAFDGFWEKHQLKMEQYLQLLKFEQSFQESAIAFLMGQQAELPDTGDSVAQVKQRLKDLGNLDGMAQDLVGKAQVVMLHGHQLAANHHYALSLICQQCNELRHHSDVLSEEIKRKHVRLRMTLDLHTRLQQALECCDEGANLLANQPMDKFQSKEGAQKALQDIDKFLESSLPYLSYDPQVLCCDFESVLTPEIKAQIQAVWIKLENVRSMFENQQTCFRKLVDKHVRPVQLVTPRPENPPRSKSPLFYPKHGKSFCHLKTFSFVNFVLSCERWSVSDYVCFYFSHVINELIETERVYVEELFTVLMGYRAEMDNPAMVILMPPALRNREDVLFGNMPEIYDFHNKIFLHNLESCVGAPERVGLCFLERVKDFQMYEKYCQNKPRSESLWRQCSESTFFRIQNKIHWRLNYCNFITSCDGVKELQEALVAMLDLLKSVNDSMHQISITGYDGDLSELGKVLMQGSFSVWAGHRKGPTKMKDLARFKPMQRHLFLYEKALVFCKKREEHGDGYDKTSSYSFKHFLKMNAVGITENVKGDHRKFEIWYSGREEVYVVQAPTVDVKMVWLSEMRKILFKQQEFIKGTFEPFPDGVHYSRTFLMLTLLICKPSHSQQRNSSFSPLFAKGQIADDSLTYFLAGWSRMSQSVEICEGLEDWSSNNYLSNCSDTEEEDGSQLVSDAYKNALFQGH